MKEIIKFKASDGETIHVRHWRPKKIKETGIILHGLGDHSGWYNEFLDHLHLKGYELYAMDRRGSGLNPGRRGDITSYKIWIRDIREFIIKKKLKKVSLVGVSFGAILALAFALKYPKHVKDIILMAPIMRSKIKFNLLFELALFYSSIFNPEKMYQLPCPSKWTVAEKKYIKKIEKDPLNQKHFTARLFREIILMRHFVRTSYKRIHVPQIIFLGDGDHIADIKYLLKFFKGNKIIMYKKVQHGMAFSKIRPMINDIDNWLKEINKEKLL